MIGIVSLEEGIKKAKDVGLDLVEVSPNADPPVCKILNYGKFKYELQKKQTAMRKKQKTITVKEIKFRPVTEENDYQVKKNNIIKFIKDGNKVKVTLKFRGREIAHPELGMQILNRLCKELDNLLKTEYSPKREGRQITMVLAPK